jgi:hypothetical protein
MRRLQQLALTGILAFGVVAHAQNRNGKDRNYNYYGNQPGNYGNRIDVIDRSQADLNRLRRIPLDSRDFGRVNDLTGNLQEFEARMAQGRFDKDRLDHIIETMQHLADSNRIPQAARSDLYRDVQALRQFRANRGYAGGYRNSVYRF